MILSITNKLYVLISSTSKTFWNHEELFLFQTSNPGPLSGMLKLKTRYFYYIYAYYELQYSFLQSNFTGDLLFKKKLYNYVKPTNLSGTVGAV